jgi:adenine-specific DNA-methyltransferase
MQRRRISLRNNKKIKPAPQTEPYKHPEGKALVRPEVGAQPRFRKTKPPTRYRYDSSLAPELCWDGQNAAREEGEALLRAIREAKTIEEAKQAAEKLARMSRPFLNWAGKAERLSFEVPTLPLFIHERLSTPAILETLKGHRRDKQLGLFDLFGDREYPLHEQIAKAYEYPNGWVNRMILGDSLVVMNSLLHFENMGGQVQMIYIDPPYGVKFGSNFQPFVRRRDVDHNDDEDMTREPEMVKAYRDTWEFGLHSYLTFLRDRFVLARDLLHPTGSVFVQISDEHLHEVRMVLDEVFGPENFAGLISFFKTSSQSTLAIQSVVDYLLVYARDRERQRLHPLLKPKEPGERGAKQYTLVISPDMKDLRRMTRGQLEGVDPIPDGWKICALGPTTSPGFQEGRSGPYKFGGDVFTPPSNRHWSYDPAPGAEMDRLARKGRLRKSGDSLRTVLLAEDNPTTELDNVWLDTGTGSFTEDQLYVVQTAEKVVERCIWMTTNPGDLVLDPTCGSGTTAFVAEKLGRRWITIDTSRVPLALARQRLLSGNFKYYELADPRRGPAGGFVYRRRQNSRGEEEGGIVPHITLKSIANDGPPKEEVLVDRPEEVRNVLRVCGPFCVEATIPRALDLEAPKDEEGDQEQRGGEAERMLEILRASPVLHVGGGKVVKLRNVRRPAKTLYLSAEAELDQSEGQKPAVLRTGDGVEGLAAEEKRPAGPAVAILFGPENGALSEVAVRNAHDEASMKSRGYTHLYVIGFAIEPRAREYVDHAAQLGVPATYVQATPDVLMGDLLKNLRTSQIFSVCGLPDVAVRRAKVKDAKEPLYEVELFGLDVFDPTGEEPDQLLSRKGEDVPAWFLDTDYNGMVFHVTQAFFPRTSAWDNLKRALKAEFDESVWEHLAGTVSTPFPAGNHRQIGVKVIDDRGNELMVVKNLDDALK